jgi:hypothetical protein
LFLCVLRPANRLGDELIEAERRKATRDAETYPADRARGRVTYGRMTPLPGVFTDVD